MRVEMNKNVTIDSLELELLKIREELEKLKEAISQVERKANDNVNKLP